MNCLICQKQFLNRSNLNRHNRVSKCSKAIQCTTCNKFYINLSLHYPDCIEFLKKKNEELLNDFMELEKKYDEHHDAITLLDIYQKLEEYEKKIDCNQKGLCQHGKRKSHCKDCGGGSMCEHGKRKYYCRKCGGNAICEHNKTIYLCKECKGNSLCEHDKLKSFCKLCGGSSLCKTPLCETTGNKKYNGYCLPCCIQTCPDVEIVRNYKTKEKCVVDSITSQFTDFDWKADKKIQDGCSKRRPDLLLDLGSHIIIVEVDENKHSGYDCSCENKRLMELSQDTGHRPIVFIRFNPDAYTDIKGNKISSCWIPNKRGVLTIPMHKKNEWDNRLQCLKEHIDYWIKNSSDKIVEIIELFY